jgi:peptide/nickel transport system permease protein
VCLVLVGVLAVAALTAPLVAPLDPAAQNLAYSAVPPDGEYRLGTDNLGRDILSRVIYGTRTALIGPILIAIGTGILATAIGLLAGYRGGRVDAITMRAIDLVYAVPPLLVAIVVIGIFDGGYALAVLVLIALSTPADVRVVRSAVLAQRELPYVAAARTVGVRGLAVALRHVLPNIEFVSGLISLSALSFLGLGAPAGTPDWGLMIAENRLILDLNPWAVVTPALLITLLAIAVTILGDRVYEIAARRGSR